MRGIEGAACPCCGASDAWLDGSAPGGDLTCSGCGYDFDDGDTAYGYEAPPPPPTDADLDALLATIEIEANVFRASEDDGGVHLIEDLHAEHAWREMGGEG